MPRPLGWFRRHALVFTLGGVVSVVAAVNATALHQLNLRFAGWVQELRGPRPSPDRIVIVAIDDFSLHKAVNADQSGAVSPFLMRINLQQRLQSLKLLAGLAAFLKNPGSLDSVFAVGASLKDSPLGEQMVQHLLADSQFQALVDEGWRPAPINLDQLQQLPEGSLGRVYADQLISQGITPNTLIDPAPVTNAQEYVVHRLKETHDIAHVLTGFGIDGASELGLQGFNLAQNRSPLAVMLIFGGMLSALQNDEPLAPMLRALARGFQMGLEADLVIARKLEDGWERPLADWRHDLKLPAETGT